MSMEGDILERLRKMERAVEALLDRHPEVRAVLQRDMLMSAVECVRVEETPDGPLIIYEAPDAN